jgi:hypothetical protein
MPHKVIVDDEVFRALQERAVPLVDMPNSVIRRLLGLSEDRVADGNMTAWQAQAGNLVEGDLEQPQTRQTRQTRRRGTRSKTSTKGKAHRAPKGVLLPEPEYELPILQTLIELGGRAPASELIAALGTKLDGKLKPLDGQRLASGEVRWKNRAQFVRLKLVRGGDMVKDSPRGIWEISDQGRRRVESETT